MYGGTDLKITTGSTPGNGGERRELFRFKPDIGPPIALPDGMTWYSADAYATRDPDKSAFYRRPFHCYMVTAHFAMLNRNEFYYYKHTAGEGPDVCNWKTGPNPKLHCITMECYDDSFSDSMTVIPMDTPRFKCAGQVNVRIPANGKEFRIYRLTGDNVVMPDSKQVWHHCAYGWMVQNVTEPPGTPGTKYMLFHPAKRMIDLPFYNAKVQYRGCAVSYDHPVGMAGVHLAPVHDASECARGAALTNNRSFGIGKNSTCMVAGSAEWMLRQGSVWTPHGCSQLDMFGAPMSNGWNTAAIYSIDDDTSFGNLKFAKPDTTPLPMPYMMPGTVKQIGCIVGVPKFFTVPLGQLGEPTNKWFACAIRATMTGFRSFLIDGNNECHGINAPNPHAFFQGGLTNSFECNNPYNEAFPIGSGISSAVYEVDEAAYNHLREYTQNGNNVHNPANGLPSPYPLCRPYCLDAGKIVPHRRYALADGSCFKTQAECPQCLDSNGMLYPEEYDKLVSCETSRDSRIANFPACKRANTGCVATPPNYTYNQIIGTKYNMPNGMCLQAITDCAGCLEKVAAGDTSEEVMQAFEFCDD